MMEHDGTRTIHCHFQWWTQTVIGGRSSLWACFLLGETGKHRELLSSKRLNSYCLCEPGWTRNCFGWFLMFDLCFVHILPRLVHVCPQSSKRWSPVSLRCLAVQVLKHIEAWRFPIISLPFVVWGWDWEMFGDFLWSVLAGKLQQTWAVEKCAKIGSIDSWVVDNFVHCYWFIQFVHSYLGIVWIIYWYSLASIYVWSWV